MKKMDDRVPVKLPFKLVELTIHSIDGYGEGYKTFDSVQQLAEFLKANPEYAKALGYVPKPSNRQ